MVDKGFPQILGYFKDVAECIDIMGPRIMSLLYPRVVLIIYDQMHWYPIDWTHSLLVYISKTQLKSVEFQMICAKILAPLWSLTLILLSLSSCPLLSEACAFLHKYFFGLKIETWGETSCFISLNGNNPDDKYFLLKKKQTSQHHWGCGWQSIEVSLPAWPVSIPLQSQRVCHSDCNNYPGSVMISAVHNLQIIGFTDQSTVPVLSEPLICSQLKQ